MFNALAVRRAMKNLRPIGLPKSIFLEDIFAKTYDSTKLEEDQERIEQFYRDNGYFQARVTDHTVDIVDVGGGKFKLPLFHPNRPGKNANIGITIEEGRLYRLNTINFVGVKLFRTPETLMRPIFGMQQGDVFSTAKLRKGFEDLRKLYGQFGYIDFVSEPDIETVPGTDKVDLTLNFDEGKQFFVRRIDFSGNTTTRDKVIRRELLIDEGDVYNTRLWELSILRLNQLGYFDALKAEDAADVKRDAPRPTPWTSRSRSRNAARTPFSSMAASRASRAASWASVIPPTTWWAWARLSACRRHVGHHPGQRDLGIHRTLLVRQTPASRLYGIHVTLRLQSGAPGVDSFRY